MLCRLSFLAASVCALSAQTPQPVKPPVAYSAIVVNSMMGPGVTMAVHRDGSRAVVEQSAPGEQAFHLRTYYDLEKHHSFTWDIHAAAAACSAGNFSGDWGDPFEMSAGMIQDLAKENLQPAGSETVNGFATKVLASAAGPHQVKVWLDGDRALVVKAQMGGQTFLELKELTVAKPPESLFTLPAACRAAPVPPPSDAERIGAETGENGANFDNAILPPPTAEDCSVLLRIVQAGTMQPVGGGFQVAIDTTVDPAHMPAYAIRESASGHATFSGGGLRELTGARNGEWRIDTVPPQFYLEAYFGRAGSASALVDRKCAGPETVLLLVVKNPEKLSDGADWLWVKSGKFAAAK